MRDHKADLESIHTPALVIILSFVCIPGQPLMDLADLPVPGKAGLSAVVAALLKRAAEQLDHSRPLRGDVSLFPFILQATLESGIHYSSNSTTSNFASHTRRLMSAVARAPMAVCYSTV